MRLDRFAVSLFQNRVDAGLVGLRDLSNDGGRVFVTSVHAVEVQHRDPAELAHRDREIDIDDPVHGRTPERQRELEALAHREGDVDLVGIERYAPRDERNLVESVSPPRAASHPDLEARLLPGNFFSGLQPALIQGVFTPMNGAGFADYTRTLFCHRCTGRSSTSTEFQTPMSADSVLSASVTRTSCCIARR